MHRGVVLSAALFSGCNMNAFAANGLVRICERAAPAVQDRDWQLAKEAVPG